MVKVIFEANLAESHPVSLRLGTLVTYLRKSMIFTRRRCVIFTRADVFKIGVWSIGLGRWRQKWICEI